MKERTREEILDSARQMVADAQIHQEVIEQYFPELKESKSKRIRRALIYILKGNFEEDTTIYDISVGDIINWLEKQDEKQETQYYCGKEELMHCLGKMVAYWADRHGCSVYEENDLMDYINIRMDAVIHLFNPNACLVDLSDCSDEYRNAYYDGYNKCNREWLKKRGEKPQGKTALEAIKEKKVDNAIKVEPKDYSSIDPHFFETTNIATKFKVNN